MGDVLFFKDKDGKKQDASLHDQIMDGGDHATVTNIGKEQARLAGVSEADILLLYADH